MTNMPDEIVLARIMKALDLEFKRALHYHDEGCDSDNDFGLPGPVMRPVHVYFISLTGLLQPCRLHESTISHPSLHTKATKG